MDFNIRKHTEILYKDTPVITSSLDLFLQEIDLVLSTDNGTVMSDRNFGLNIETLLWKTTYNEKAIESLIRDQIKTNCLNGNSFNWDIKFSVSKGTNRDIGVLEVDIKNKDNVQLSRTNIVFK